MVRVVEGKIEEKWSEGNKTYMYFLLAWVKLQ